MMRWAIAVSLLAAACTRSGGGGGDDDDDDATEARQACEDFIDSLATIVDQCGLQPYDDFRSDLLDGCCEGSCNNVVALRDADEMFSECIPWADGLECAEVSDPGFEVDPSCEAQLLH